MFECFLVQYQSPEDVYGEECDGQGDEADRLQATIEVQVVLRTPQTQPARDGRQGRYKQEAHHVTEEGPLLVPRARIPEPLKKNVESIKMQNRYIFQPKKCHSSPLPL